MAVLRNRYHEFASTPRGDGRMVGCWPDETIEVTEERAAEVTANDPYWVVVEADPKPADPVETPPVEPPADPAPAE